LQIFLSFVFYKLNFVNLRTTTSFVFLLLFSILEFSTASAQEDKSTTAPAVTFKKEKERKNTIFYNLSNTMIFGGKSQVFCYERVVGKYQSFTVELGTFSMPKISILPGNLQVNKQTSQTGYKFAGDYRFYLGGENKFNAPRGIYFAPYTSFNYFERKSSFTIDTSSTNSPVQVDVDTRFRFTTGTFGVEMGYQFVFWKRIALDLILLGPGVTAYSIKTELNTSLTPDAESELFQAINDALSEKIPGYSSVIKPSTFNSKGSIQTTSVGFRYLIHIGYRF
jgi:hypothetical protein